MSDTGPTVPGMIELPRRYNVTVTVDRDGGHPPNPAVFAMAAERVASARVVQHRERAHGQPDRQYRYRPSCRSAAVVPSPWPSSPTR